MNNEIKSAISPGISGEATFSPNTCKISMKVNFNMAEENEMRPYKTTLIADLVISIFL